MHSFNETCQEYFNRRIREGWKCISLEGHNAVLLSPDGFKRELDLRNDVETLMPNAGGDETNLNYFAGVEFLPPDVDHNWEQMDDHDVNGDPDPDDDSTVVETTGEEQVWKRDLYNLPSHSAGSDTINKITVFTRCKNYPGSSSGIIKICIKSDSVVTEGAAKGVAAESTWENFSDEWAQNPAPDPDEDWTWDDIDDLQIGVSLCTLTSKDETFSTIIYVEVDYTPASSFIPYPLLSGMHGGIGEVMGGGIGR